MNFYVCFYGVGVGGPSVCVCVGWGGVGKWGHLQRMEFSLKQGINL